MLRFGETELPPGDAIVFDFDGTIADNGGGWENPTEPVEGVKEVLEELKQMGYYIIVSSCRTASYWPDRDPEDQVKLITEFLDKFEIPYDEIWGGDKPLGAWYVDDRGFNATGDNWDELISMAEKRQVNTMMLAQLVRRAETR